MEILWLLSILLFPLILLCISIQRLKLKTDDIGRQGMITTSLPLPPGSNGWPVVGESLDYFFKLWHCVPEKFVSERRVKHSDSIFKTSLLGEPMAILCGAEGNKFLISNESKLVHPWWPKSIDKIFPKSNLDFMKQDSPKVRKILHPFLKADALQNYVPVMDQVMKTHLVTDWSCRDQLKVAPAVSKYTFTLACRLFLSIEDGDRVEELMKPFGDLTAGIVSMAINLPGTAFNRAIKASTTMRKDIEGMIKKRKEEEEEEEEETAIFLEKKEDLLWCMMNGNMDYDEFLTESDLASTMLGLLHAGTHTLNVALTFIAMYLAELPHVYDEVFKEQRGIAKWKKENGEVMLNWDDIKKMKYSCNVVSEVLRLRPPSLGTFREAIVDFTYGGYFIPKGWKVHMISHSTHKNPDYFPDPEKFDPSRFDGKGPRPYTFVPFGGGPRMCPGNEFARIVMLVFMHNLVNKFKWEKAIPNERVVIDPLPRPVQGLPIWLHSHDH